MIIMKSLKKMVRNFQKYTSEYTYIYFVPYTGKKKNKKKKSKKKNKKKKKQKEAIYCFFEQLKKDGTQLSIYILLWLYT